jgi:hypothetical protein
MNNLTFLMVGVTYGNIVVEGRPHIVDDLIDRGELEFRDHE